jgi:hypothetical protein
MLRWKLALRQFVPPEEQVDQQSAEILLATLRNACVLGIREPSVSIYLECMKLGLLVPNQMFKVVLYNVASWSNMLYLKKIIEYQLNTVSQQCKSDLGMTYKAVLVILIAHDQTTYLGTYIDQMVKNIDSLSLESPEKWWAIIDALVASNNVLVGRISKLSVGILLRFPEFKPSSESLDALIRKYVSNRAYHSAQELRRWMEKRGLATDESRRLARYRNP